MGVSAPSLHKESTDSLIIIPTKTAEVLVVKFPPTPTQLAHVPWVHFSNITWVTEMPTHLIEIRSHIFSYLRYSLCIGPSLAYISEGTQREFL